MARQFDTFGPRLTSKSITKIWKGFYVGNAIVGGAIIAMPHPQNIPMYGQAHPEDKFGDGDDPFFCNKVEHMLYMKLISMYLCIVSLGRVDIVFAVYSLSRYLNAPQLFHLKLLLVVTGYLINALMKHDDKHC